MQNRYLLAIKYIYWQLNLFIGNKIIYLLFFFQNKNICSISIFIGNKMICIGNKNIYLLC